MSVVDLIDFIERLDRILLLKNTTIKANDIYSALVEYITNLLRDYCNFYEKRVGALDYEITLLYSCNENKTCIHVEIKPVPLDSLHDKLDVSYIITGSKCGTLW